MMASENVGEGDSKINNAVSSTKENEKGDSKCDDDDKKPMVLLKNYSDPNDVKELRAVKKGDEDDDEEEVSSIKSGGTKTADQVSEKILQDEFDQVLDDLQEWKVGGEEEIEKSDGEKESEDEESEGSENCWSAFLYHWRRQFGPWGKRMLDVSGCANSNRAKIDHLLIECHRRRSALAATKAHILYLSDIAQGGNGKLQDQQVDFDQK